MEMGREGKEQGISLFATSGGPGHISTSVWRSIEPNLARQRSECKPLHGRLDFDNRLEGLVSLHGIESHS